MYNKLVSRNITAVFEGPKSLSGVQKKNDGRFLPVYEIVNSTFWPFQRDGIAHNISFLQLTFLLFFHCEISF